MNPYQISTDYSLLYDLLKQGHQIVCFTDDFLQASVLSVQGDILCGNSLMAIASFSKKTKESFINLFEKRQIKWIVPTIVKIDNYTIHLFPKFTKYEIQWLPVVSYMENVMYYSSYYCDEIVIHAYENPLNALL